MNTLHLLAFACMLSLTQATMIFYAKMRFCSMRRCRTEMQQCWADETCSYNQACWRSCDSTKVAKCSYDCGLYSDALQHTLIQCQADKDCFPENNGLGHCLARDDEAVQEDILDKVANSDWWVLKTTTEHDCAADKAEYGTHNKAPCSKVSLGSVSGSKVTGDQSYCFGENSVCETEFIHTEVEATSVAPGVLSLRTMPRTGVFQPVLQKLKFLSFPHPDWALAASCISGPGISMNGLFLLSKHKSLSQMPANVASNFARVAQDFGINFNQMCVSDVTNCTN